MIAELFYPKELKEVIADLRAKDDFDSATFERMNAYLNKRIFIFLGLIFIAAILFFIANDVAVKIFIPIVICLMAYGGYSEISKYWKFPILYVQGKEKTGNITRCVSSKYLSPVGWDLDYKFSINEKTFFGSSGHLTSWLAPRQYFHDEEILVFFKPSNPNQNVPLTEELYHIFYLRKK